MKAVIISGGYSPSEELLQRSVEDSDLLICADRGADYAYKYNIIPDFIVGDCDSVNSEILDFFVKEGCEFIRFPKDKDFTDTELACKLAIEKKADNIIFLGCTGTRVDHMLGSIGVLRSCLEQNVGACIADDNNTIFFTDKPLEITGEEGTYFSLQAFGESINNLTIKNAKFPLTNYTLKTGDSRTISNEFGVSPVKLTFDKGSLLIILSKD